MGVSAAPASKAAASRPMNVLVFGAHPDDCDFRCGGIALKYRALGHRVKFVSLANGDAGHFSMGGGPLAVRRYQEAQASARVADIEYEVLDIHDGELEATVFMRKWVIQIMRQWEADLVICHRANDYHPDHRAVGVLVQDASYTVTVPNIAPLTPALKRAPVVAYAWDGFQLPNPFVADVAVDTDDVFDRKVDMLHCHVSQVYEWLPYSSGELERVPVPEVERREWQKQRMLRRFGTQADAVRDKLVQLYGPTRGQAVKTSEAFMISEYGRRPAAEELPVLFPFFPGQTG